MVRLVFSEMGAEVTKNLDELLQQGLLWRGRNGPLPTARAVLPSGFERLDESIGGGWPRGALVEILSQGPGLSLLLPVLAKLSRKSRWLAWVDAPWLPYVPALTARGLDVSRILLIRGRDANQGLWAAEQALRSGNCAAVMLWPRSVSNAQARRLQLAAEEGDCLGVLFRSRKALGQSSTAALRLEVQPSGGKLEVQVHKRPAGWGGRRLLL
ncbi:translesion DNA synthesis-associated protein ImuA [Thiolapillus sp.]